LANEELAVSDVAIEAGKDQPPRNLTQVLTVLDDLTLLLAKRAKLVRENAKIRPIQPDQAETALLAKIEERIKDLCRDLGLQKNGASS
jgi:hypothetical protein